MAKPVRSQAKSRREPARVDCSRVPTPEEIDRLRSWATRELEVPGASWQDTQAAAVALVLLGTGARRFEACALLCGSVYEGPAGAVCEFPETKGGARGVIVPVAAETVAHVQRWLELRRARGEVVEAGEPLFSALPRQPLALKTMNRYFSRALQAAGVPDRYGPHAARHAGAFLLLRATGRYDLVKRFLRHSSVKTTEQCYEHFALGDVREALRRAGL